MCEENVMPVSLAKLVTAFAKAKLEMGKLVATEKANLGSYNYTYADMAGVLGVIDKPLASNGLVFVQSPVVEYKAPGAIVTVHGTLYHESGEYLLAAPLVMMSQQTDPQKVGSAITYGRRYQAVAFFGLAQEDDDGKSAGDKPRQQAQPQRPQAPAPQPAQHRQATPTNGHTNGATKPSAPTTVITPAEVAASDAITLDNVPEVPQDGNDNPFTPDAAQAQRIASGFAQPPVAQAWAVSEGYCENEFAARNSFVKVVTEKFNGKLTQSNMKAAILAFVEHQLAKANQKEQVAA